MKNKKLARKDYLRENYEKYRKIRNLVKTKIIEAKAKEWENFGQKMEHNSKNNQKLFCKGLKNMRGRGKLVSK